MKYFYIFYALLTQYLKFLAVTTLKDYETVLLFNYIQFPYKISFLLFLQLQILHNDIIMQKKIKRSAVSIFCHDDVKDDSVVTRKENKCLANCSHKPRENLKVSKHSNFHLSLYM